MHATASTRPAFSQHDNDNNDHARRFSAPVLASHFVHYGSRLRKLTPRSTPHRVKRPHRASRSSLASLSALAPSRSFRPRPLPPPPPPALSSLPFPSPPFPSLSASPVSYVLVVFVPGRSHRLNTVADHTDEIDQNCEKKKLFSPRFVALFTTSATFLPQSVASPIVAFPSYSVALCVLFFGRREHGHLHLPYFLPFDSEPPPTPIPSCFARRGAAPPAARPRMALPVSALCFPLVLPLRFPRHALHSFVVRSTDSLVSSAVSAPVFCCFFFFAPTSAIESVTRSKVLVASPQTAGGAAVCGPATLFLRTAKHPLPLDALPLGACFRIPSTAQGPEISLLTVLGAGDAEKNAVTESVRGRTGGTGRTRKGKEEDEGGREEQRKGPPRMAAPATKQSGRNQRDARGKNTSMTAYTTHRGRAYCAQ